VCCCDVILTVSTFVVVTVGSLAAVLAGLDREGELTLSRHGRGDDRGGRHVAAVLAQDHATRLKGLEASSHATGGRTAGHVSSFYMTVGRRYRTAVVQTPGRRGTILMAEL
jgi:hypothetical protein